MVSYQMLRQWVIGITKGLHSIRGTKKGMHRYVVKECTFYRNEDLDNYSCCQNKWWRAYLANYVICYVNMFAITSTLSVLYADSVKYISACWHESCQVHLKLEDNGPCGNCKASRWACWRILMVDYNLHMSLLLAMSPQLFLWAHYHINHSL